MKEIRELEKQRDLILDAMAVKINCTPRKYLINGDGSLEDITKYMSLTIEKSYLDYIQQHINSFYNKQTPDQS